MYKELESLHKRHVLAIKTVFNKVIKSIIHTTHRALIHKQNESTKVQNPRRMYGMSSDSLASQERLKSHTLILLPSHLSAQAIMA